jgi:phosphoenolpyruvate carboxylase
MGKTPPPGEIEASDHRLFRRDVRLLRWQLNRVLREHGSRQLWDVSERLRQLARRRREGHSEAGREIQQELARLSADQLHQLVRVQGCDLELVNLAEDRHRLRILRQRDARSYPAARGESIGAAIETLARMGWSAQRVQELLDRLEICPVFTAHPTEAKRVTVRHALARMREDLYELERTDLLRREREEVLSHIRSDLMCLWETDTVRPRRPTVLEEVSRNLFVAGTLWEVVPQLYRDLRSGLRRTFAGHSFHIARFLRFGTWIGGDRDGNPYVTAEVTRQTMELLREDALRRHREACRDLESRLSVSDRYHPIGAGLADAIRQARQRWPDVDRALAAYHPHEPYRHWLVIIEHRLAAAAEMGLDSPSKGLAYASSDQLLRDVELIARNLRESGHRALADGPVQEWLDRIAVLGFHIAELDIREESPRLGATVQELATQMQVCPDFAALAEPQKLAFLLAPPELEAVRSLDLDLLTPDTRETLDLFRLLARTIARLGRRPLGTLIVSMTHSASDVLTMLWLSRVGAAAEGVLHTPLPIVPLFETVTDLERGEGILRQLFQQPDYLAMVRSEPRGQICMIGYSDSVKDGGYLAANWHLYDAQRTISKLADEFQLPITFFHGRGGALGRGGGPAARAVLSLPADSVRGRLRVTEQGEIVAERYGDPQIAHRHLEQLSWATLLVSAEFDPRPHSAWADMLGRAAIVGLAAYRRLVEDPALPAYFRSATPIEVIESLPIGSRPSRRGDRPQMTQLRAIPYTFAWTQSRHLLTGYYGLGSGLAAVVEGDWSILCRMYDEWPFFRALIDNAELALAKVVPDIIHRYAAIMPDHEAADRIAAHILVEYEVTKDAVLYIKRHDQLLATTDWLRHSIALRNPDVDLLNFIQIEMLQRRRQLTQQSPDSPELAALDEMLRSSVQALSTGLRTTG